ncbi:MAG: pyridoxal phosphate-dependent aminotransferase family protein [Sphingobacteriales bacterium]|nr:pyridoxal phosphate-dependent aminotransferase family protein [Sphingobacteriales bacterium]
MELDERIQGYLQSRKENHLYRQLTHSEQLIDFSSNDYLGLAHSAFIRQQVDDELGRRIFCKSGATGSRLLNGNSVFYTDLEKMLAEIHHAAAALMFNSGFDANVGLLSTVIQKQDIIYYDELVHASIHQGMKLSGAEKVSFRHNDMKDLEEKLRCNTEFEVRFIISESMFSMEGDKAKLKELAILAKQYKAKLIIDEAHATGLFGINGSGLCNEAGVEESCFARVYTFGKAVGSHGAAVVCSELLKNYLINFSRNLIYSTALETNNLLRVKHSYFFIQSNKNQLFKLNKIIKYFKFKLSMLNNSLEVCGDGPIFGLVIGDNLKCKDTAAYLQSKGFDVRAILSPTVPTTTERIRIILHSFNTVNQIDRFFYYLIDYQSIDK